MSTLSRYIARQYITNVLVLLVLLCSFVVMIDVSVNLSRYARAAGQSIEAASAADAGGASAGANAPAPAGALLTAWQTVGVIADIWWPQLLQLFNYIIGLVLVGAMGFTFTQLARHRELVAMLAGGVSLFRAARPVLFVALFFTAIQVANQEFVLPRISHLLTRDAGDAGQRESTSFQVPVTPDAAGLRLEARRFEPATGRLLGVNIWQCDERGLAVKRTTADSARYDGGGWVLENPRAVGFSPGDRPPQPPTRIATDLDPTTLLARQFVTYSATLSWRQINRVLDAPTLRQDLRTRLSLIGWGRLSSLLCSFLSLLVTLPFFLTREPENLLIQALKSAPVAIITLLGGTLGATIAVPGLPPSVSVFIPVLVLAPLAVAALSSIKT